MKKSIIFSSIIVLSISSGFAYTDHNIQSANFIAEKWIINDNSFTPSWYNLDDNITRREMLKILMNLSWKEVIDRCLWAFQDIATDDWGCKYAEAAVKEWYIAKNTNFRPNDLVTQIEALKMIMQGKNIERNNTADWRDWYKQKAETLGIIDDNYLDYDKSAVRWWIFSNSARSYSDFKYQDSGSGDNNYDSSELPPEIQELFDNLGADYDI
jgi:hypothetical protein